VPPQFTVIAAAKVSGCTCCISAFAAGQPGLSWSTAGKRGMGTESACSLSNAGRHVARLNFPSILCAYFEASLLVPATACRDLEIAGQSLARAIDETKRAANAEVIGPDQLAALR